MRIELPHGETTLIDDEDWELVKDLTLYFHEATGYVYVSKRKIGKLKPLHALLVGSHPGKQVDHIDGDKLNNRRANLRIVTYQQNQVNRHKLNKNNQTGVRGVYYYPKLNPNKPWMVQLMVNGKNKVKWLKTKDEAVTARLSLELEHYGEVCP